MNQSFPMKGLRSLARRAYATAFDSGVAAFSSAARALPWADPARHGVVVEQDVRYGPDPAHLLDVWRPKDVKPNAPVAIYFHGGGFSLCSKESHWIMGLVFARRGFVTFNVDYRLAPASAFPAAHEDAARAYRFVLDSAAKYGGDASNIVVSGESAGANLTLSLAIASCFERREPWAQEVFARGVVPKAIMPACGILQVTDPDRFERSGAAGPFVASRIQAVTSGYLRGCKVDDADAIAMVDPLCILEKSAVSDAARPLPPMFIPCGTLDWIKDDTIRLEKAAQALGVRAHAKLYQGGVHAFHAVAVSERAKTCWRDWFRFIRDELPAGAFDTSEL